MKFGGSHCVCLHYTQVAAKCKAFIPECYHGGVVFQEIIAALPKPVAGVLGGDAAAGVAFGNSVPGHKPPDPRFLRGSDGNGCVAELCQLPFKQGDGVDSGIARAAFQKTKDLGFYGTVGNAV